MPYGTIYRIQFTTTQPELQPVTIELAQKSTFDEGADTTYIDLKGGPSPLVVQSLDANEGKFSPLRAKSCTLQFISTDTIGIHTFATGEDDEFPVTIWVGNSANVVFRGFLVMDDNEQGYVTYKSEVVILTATDNLGLLKETALVDASGANPKGKFKIIQFIAWALKQTGMALPINVINNLCEESYPGLPFYDHIYLDAKTFESQIGVSEDAYTVLSKIFGEDCYLTQFKGEWWIIRVDELEGGFVRRHRFDADGGFISTYTDETYKKTITHGGSIEFVNEVTTVTLQRPHSFAKLGYRYEYPLEIIDNIDFSRGDWISPLTLPDEVVDGKTYSNKGYNVADWTLKRGLPDGPAQPNTSIAYIKRAFYEGYEVERYLVITAPGNYNNLSPYVESNPVAVGLKDKFSVGVDFRFPSQITTASGYLVFIAVRLLGEDGSKWWLGLDSNGDTQWLLSISNWNQYSFSPGPAIPYNFAGVDDEKEWQNTSWNAPPCPVAGEVTIELHGMYQQNVSQQNIDIHYQNLRFDYQPYINGSYAKYNGHYNKLSQPGNYRAKIDEPVHLGDAPRQLFKGAMFKLVGGKYVLAERWYNAAVFPGGLPDAAFLKSYGNTQAFSVWNQYRNPNTIFRASLIGIESGSAPDMPDVVHQYAFGDSNPNADNKQFFAVSFRMDYYLLEWTATLIEVYDSVKGKVFDDPYELKFEQG